MTRATSRTRRLLVGCIAATASIAVAAGVLHARGISFALTRTYFTFGPVHAQNAMGGMAKPAAPQSTGLAVTVDGKTAAYSVAELNAMPQKTVKVHNEHARADETYTGVALGDVLTKAGFVVSKPTQREMLRSYVRAEGTDNYWVLYSLTEVEPSEHEGDVIVATAMDGKPLGADGQLKLISSEDRKPQRWVRNLTAITVTQGQ